METKKKTDWGKVFGWVLVLIESGKYAVELAKERGLMDTAEKETEENE